MFYVIARVTDDLPIAVVDATDTGRLTVQTFDAGREGGDDAVPFGAQSRNNFLIHPAVVTVEMLLLLLLHVVGIH